MENSLQEKIRRYYTSYYRDDCARRDFQDYVAARCVEEETEQRRLADLELRLGPLFRPGQKHFILGAGTGGLGVVLARDYGCSVAGIEPNPEAIEIVKEKMRAVGADPGLFKAEYGESIGFPDDSFDFVHAVSVIEHVDDVPATLAEMIRITKPGGRIYIHCPNYAFPFEGHYKIPFPVFLPRWCGALYLKALGKSSRFLSTINFLSQRRLQRILFHFRGIDFIYFYRGARRSVGRMPFIWSLFPEKLGIYPYQEVLIFKHKHEKPLL